MSAGRILASAASVLAVAGCAVLVIGMSGGDLSQSSAGRPDVPASTAATSSRAGSTAPGAAIEEAPGLAPAASGAATGATPPRSATSAPSVPPTTAARSTPSASQRPPAAHPAPSSAPRAPSTPAPVRGGSLPVSGTTSGADQVITVLASSYSSHTATLQSWRRAPGGGWLKVGSAVLAHVGSQGLTTAPSESKSATPIGSFSLTQAFGYYGNPGTALSYFQTTPSDYWISDPGPYYNTHQRCSSCGYNDGVNERLYYETPYYNYAVVINTPSGSSAYPHGSAFFLHVTDGNPTAGCVAIPQANLVSILKWLNPADHPRILIGVA